MAADLARIASSGFDLLANNGSLDLVPADDCTDCCCECTVERDLNCATATADFGPVGGTRSIQIDLNLTPSFTAAQIAQIDSTCPGPGGPVITFPDLNGTYVLTPQSVTDNTLRCHQVYWRYTHVPLTCHRVFARPQTMVLLVWLMIDGVAFFPHITGNSTHTVAGVEISTSTIWLDDADIPTIDAEGTGSFGDFAAAVGDIQTTVNRFNGRNNAASIHPLGGLTVPQLVRSHQREYNTDLNPFPFVQQYRFEPSAQCRPACNEIVNVGPPDWVNTFVNDQTQFSNNFGPAYNGTITSVQV